jgi:uncharacterized protein (TIGR03067 family)
MTFVKTYTAQHQRITARPLSALIKIAVIVLLLSIVFSAQAQETDAALQGSWTVIAGEHGGRPMDSMNGGIMEVKGDRFRISTSSGTLLEGQLILDSSKTPALMVMQHDSGMRWEAIYEVSGNDFRMNYIDAAGPDPLPEVFRTSEETEASVVVLTRSEP